MLWRIYQLAVFFGVYALFVENGWTKDLGAAPLIVSVFAAWIATAIPLAIVDLAQRGRQNRSHKRRSIRASRGQRGIALPPIDRVDN